ncbi:MAG: ATP-binding cassette domain-containing protein [Erythrobacter sp.]|nr:ATP-binding cassette domain-containing protein [Erythrobacter sp.]NCQ62491.1 ATP-binding cassette domain-containing protein [Alphaproteobacteria bacterium]
MARENPPTRLTRRGRAVKEDGEARSSRSLAPLRMIYREAARFPKQIVFALASLLVTSAATLAIPWRFKVIIDKAFGGGAEATEIAHSFQYLLMIVVVLGIGTAFRYYFVSWLGERVVANIRLKVQQNLLRQSPSFYEENSPKEISSRMTSDTAIIETVVGSTVSIALRNSLTAIGGIFLLLYLAPTLTLGLLLGIVLIVVPIVYFGRKIRAVSRTTQDRVADVGRNVTEVLGAMHIVQSFGQESRESEKFARVVERTFETAKRRILLRAIMTSVVIVMIFGGITLVMWRGALAVTEGTITGGTIAAFVLTGGLVAGALGALTEVYGDLLRGAGAADRLAELLQAEPQIAPPASPQPLPVPARGSLSFRNVGFAYPSRPGEAVIDDLTLEIEPGETVALVGPSGAGKSTLFMLAQRFYDPSEGTIRIDGIALPSADPAEIRARMAYVPQAGTLFSGSARDNLRYGRWDASDAEIWEAARLANAAGFIEALPQGLDTDLGEDGTRLSGGQQQRIAIARAILRDAPILLLDEATSALDAESERLVQDALARVMRGRTTLVIAHRLATVREADRIVVLEGGRIVQQGTHAELVAHGGLYGKLAQLQFDPGPASAK